MRDHWKELGRELFLYRWVWCWLTIALVQAIGGDRYMSCVALILAGHADIRVKLQRMDDKSRRDA
jgi:hypothetical protein